MPPSRDEDGPEMPLRRWPAVERPRERLQALGARELAEAELLALLLRTGAAGTSAMALARRLQALAAERGGFARLDLADLLAVPGVGLAKAAGLLAAREWGRRQSQPPLPAPPPLGGPAAAAAALRSLLGGRREEHVAVLALDARRRLLASELVSRGSLTQSMAHPREVFRCAVKLGAAAVVVGHNHPSGDPEPSPEDDSLTFRLRAAADLLGIPMLDHVIVGEGSYFSYAEGDWRSRPGPRARPGRPH